ncbi:MAG: ABC transporter permease [Hyphomicrobiaceae bacterium]
MRPARAGLGQVVMRRHIDSFALAFRLPIIIWQSIFFLGPLLFMVAMTFFLVKNYRMVEAFELANWAKMLSRGYFWDSYVVTLTLAAIATVSAMLIAFPAAYALAFYSTDATRRFFILLLIVPFFTSYLVRTFSWYVILAETGVVNSLLRSIGLGPYTMLNTKFGTIVGYLTLTLPLVVILQTLALANIDKALVEAARNLGCPPWRTLYSVVLPLARTGFIVAALFCFILSFGDFVAPYYLGGSKPPTLPILIIDTTKSGQQWPRAAVVAVVMMMTLFAIAFVAIMTAYASRRDER